MWLIDLEAAPPRLRGLLSRWAVEVRGGLYVGSTSAKVRDAIWRLVERGLGLEANAVLVYDARNPQGFEVRTAGTNRREIVDVDGLWLAQFHPPVKEGTVPLPDILAEDIPEPEDDIDEVDPLYLEDPD